ncbi:hypothetical protein MRY87_10970 [bacterium]|nr:hypothetical protein [bacterium]
MQHSPFLGQFFLSLLFICLGPMLATENLSAETPEDSSLKKPSLHPMIEKAEALYSAENYEGCIEILNAGKKRLRPSDLDRFYFLLGQTYQQLEKPQLARKALVQSLEYRARNSDILHLLGQLAIESKNFSTAEQYLQEAIWFHRYTEYEPGRSWYLLSQVYESLGLATKMVSALEMSAKLGNSTGAAGKNDGALRLARVKIQQGELAAANQILGGFSSEKPVENLEKEVLLAQISLLSPRSLSQQREMHASAERLSTMLPFPTDTAASPETDRAGKQLSSFAHEILIRSWLNAGNLGNAAAALAQGREHLSSPQIAKELEEQLSIETERRPSSTQEQDISE